MVKRKLRVPDKRHTAKRILLLLAGLLVIAGGIFAVLKFAAKPPVSEKCRELPFNASDRYAYAGGGIMYSSGGTVAYMDFSDEDNNISYGTQASDVMLAASEGIRAIYNASAMQIIGVEYPAEFSGTVVSVKCARAHIGVLRSDTAGNMSLLVYASDGTQSAQIDFTGADVINFGFSESAAENETLWTVTLEDSGSVPVQTITTYDLLKNATTGVMSVQHQLVSSVIYTSKSIFAIGTTNVIRYDPTTNAEQYRVLVYGYKLHDFSSSGSRPLFMFVPRDTAALDSVKLYALSETELANARVADIMLSDNTVSAFVSGDSLYAFTPNTLDVFSSSGELKSSETLDFTVDEAIKLSDTYAILRSGDNMRLLPLR